MCSCLYALLSVYERVILLLFVILSKCTSYARKPSTWAWFVSILYVMNPRQIPTHS